MNSAVLMTCTGFCRSGSPVLTTSTAGEYGIFFVLTAKGLPLALFCTPVHEHAHCQSAFLLSE